MATEREGRRTDPHSNGGDFADKQALRGGVLAEEEEIQREIA